MNRSTLIIGQIGERYLAITRQLTIDPKYGG